MPTHEHRCVYHVPYPINAGTTVGGQVRASKMLAALQDWGEVWTVSGTSAQRRRMIRQVRRAISSGVHFDFCYSESSTMPTILTDPHHLPLHPLMDLEFMAWLRRRGVPVGLFYRDIYWKFPVYDQSGVPGYQRFVAKTAYHYDLLGYRKALDVLFLPSLRMGEYVDVGPTVRKVALPPGHDIDALPPEPSSSPLSLFYVGGVGPLYQMQELFAAVSSLPQVKLVICTRPAEWQAQKKDYQSVMGPNISVVHANGKAALAPYFAAANVALMVFKPDEYRDFAAPLKLFEYIGNGKPIMATTGTLAGDIIGRDRIGWVVDYDREEISGVLRRLSEHPEEVTATHQRVMATRDRHTWNARVDELSQTLAEMDRRLS
jgi:glycosyltransferase involved in cell wall biosynthesis